MNEKEGLIQLTAALQDFCIQRQCSTCPLLNKRVDECEMSRLFNLCRYIVIHEL